MYFIYFIISLGLVFLVYKIAGNKKNTLDLTEQEPETSTINTPEKLLYKKKGLKRFDMKGMYYRSLTPEIHEGKFYGFAECEDNMHDQYAVAIYNDKNELLGYTPKNNKRLNDSLREWHGGKIFAWGWLSYDPYDSYDGNSSWSGTVIIPIGLTAEEINTIHHFHRLKNQFKTALKLNKKTTESYFELLSIHSQIMEQLAVIKNPEFFNHSFPKNLLPSISRHLEKEKNWERLIALEKHQDLIAALSDKYKQSTLNRISKAKTMVND